MSDGGGTLEIERRFLVRAAPELLRRADVLELRQGYLTEQDPITVRIRQEGERWVLAIKADAEGIARHEIELDVREAQARALLELARGGTVEKARHRVGRWEIDVYHGRYEGLVLAEVELEREDEPLPETPAGLELLRELTHETGLSSRGLARLDADAARALVEELYDDG